jgi:hypothetical protein
MTYVFFSDVVFNFYFSTKSCYYMSALFIFWLIFFLLIFLLIILLLVADNRSATNITGGYQAFPSLDGTIINQCGQQQNLPCSFKLNTLNAALNRCGELGNICSAFSYDGTTMKVINPQTTFFNNQTSYFKKN